MATERRDFHAGMPHPLQLAWSDWLRQHGVDPRDVPLHGWVEADAERERITYLAYARGPRGEVLVAEDRRSARTEIRRAHLGHPPAPFPDADPA
jgi:hypothetical protein